MFQVLKYYYSACFYLGFEAMTSFIAVNIGLD